MVNEVYSVIYKNKQTKIPPDAQHRSLSANFCSVAQISVLETNSISKIKWFSSQALWYSRPKM